MDETPPIDMACDLLDVSSRDGVTAWAVGYRGLILRTPPELQTLSVTSVSPGSGNQLTVSLELTVEGTGFLPGAGVKLVKGASTISGYNETSSPGTYSSARWDSWAWNPGFTI